MAMLAEKRQKVRWVLNPRNTEWSNDSNKFGQRLMEQMGWKAGCGLGTNLQGSTEHVKVSVRSDNRGIGFKDCPEDVLPHQDKFSDLLAQLAVNEQVIPVQDKGASLESKSRQSRARVHYHKFTRSKDLSRYSQKDLECILGKSGTVVEAYQNVHVNAHNSSVSQKNNGNPMLDNDDVYEHKCEVGEDSLSEADLRKQLIVKNKSIPPEEKLSTLIETGKKRKKARKGCEDSLPGMDDIEQLKVTSGSSIDPEENPFTHVRISKKKQKKVIESSKEGLLVTDGCENLEVTRNNSIDLEETSVTHVKTSSKKRKRVEATSKDRLSDTESCKELKVTCSNNIDPEESSVTQFETSRKKRKRVKESEDCLSDADCCEKLKVGSKDTNFDSKEKEWSIVKTKKTKRTRLKDKPEDGCKIQNITTENDMKHFSTHSATSQKKEKKAKASKAECLLDKYCPVEQKVKNQSGLVPEETSGTHVECFKKRKKQKRFKEEKEESLHLEISPVGCLPGTESCMIITNEELPVVDEDKQQKKHRKKKKELKEDKLTTSYVTEIPVEGQHTPLSDDSLTTRCVKDRRKKKRDDNIDCDDVKHCDFQVESKEKKKRKKRKVNLQECDDAISTTDFIKQDEKLVKSVRFSENCEVVLIPSCKVFPDDNTCTNVLADNSLVSNCPTDSSIKTVVSNHRILNGVKYINGIAQGFGNLQGKLKYAPNSNKNIPFWQRNDLVVDFPGSNLVTLGYGETRH